MRPILPKGTMRLSPLNSSKNQIAPPPPPKATVILLVSPSTGLQFSQNASNRNNALVRTALSNKMQCDRVPRRKVTSNKRTSKVPTKTTKQKSVIKPILPKQPIAPIQINETKVPSNFNMPSMLYSCVPLNESKQLSESSKSCTVNKNCNSTGRLISSQISDIEQETIVTPVVSASQFRSEIIDGKREMIYSNSNSVAESSPHNFTHLDIHDDTYRPSFDEHYDNKLETNVNFQFKETDHSLSPIPSVSNTTSTNDLSNNILMSSDVNLSTKDEPRDDYSENTIQVLNNSLCSSNKKITIAELLPNKKCNKDNIPKELSKDHHPPVYYVDSEYPVIQQDVRTRKILQLGNHDNKSNYRVSIPSYSIVPNTSNFTVQSDKYDSIDYSRAGQSVIQRKSCKLKTVTKKHTSQNDDFDRQVEITHVKFLDSITNDDKSPPLLIQKHGDSDDQVKDYSNPSFSKVVENNYSSIKYIEPPEYGFENINMSTLNSNNEEVNSCSSRNSMHCHENISSIINEKGSSNSFQSGRTYYQVVKSKIPDPTSQYLSLVQNEPDIISVNHLKDTKSRDLHESDSEFPRLEYNNKSTAKEESKSCLYKVEPMFCRNNSSYHHQDKNIVKPPSYQDHFNSYKSVESDFQLTPNSDEPVHFQIISNESEVYASPSSDSHVYTRRANNLPPAYFPASSNPKYSNDLIRTNSESESISTFKSVFQTLVENQVLEKPNDEGHTKVIIENSIPPMYEFLKCPVFDLSNSASVSWLNEDENQVTEHPLPLLSKKKSEKPVNDSKQDLLIKDMNEVLSFVESAEKILMNEENSANPIYLQRKQQAEDILQKIESQHVSRSAEMVEKFGIVEDVPIDKSIVEGLYSKKQKPVKVKQKQSLLCQICGKMLSQRSSLKAHLAMHRNDKEYQCPYCSKGFNHGQVLRNHIRTHTLERPWKCSLCPANFATNSALIKHKVKHTIERPHECPVCSKTFKTNAVLKSHTRSHDVGPFVCSQCGKVFNGMRSLAVHQTSHKFITKKYSCPHCKKRYLFRSLLTRHMQVHFNIRKHCCHVCGAAFVWKSSLTTHIRTHSNVRINCSLCKASFVSEKRLQFHYLKHVDPCPHKCEECNQSFSHAYRLANHMQRHKKRYLSLHCKICDIHFPTKKDLKSHKEVHS